MRRRPSAGGFVRWKALAAMRVDVPLEFVVFAREQVAAGVVSSPEEGVSTARRAYLDDIEALRALRDPGAAAADRGEPVDGETRMEGLLEETDTPCRRSAHEVSRHRLTADARLDLRDIRGWLIDGRPARAASVLSEPPSTFRLLGSSPVLGRHRPELRDGLRSFQHKDDAIFHRPNGDGVDVVRMMHARRDLANIVPH